MICPLKTMTLMKKTDKDTNIWKDIPHSCIGKITVVKCSYYPKQSTDSMQFLSKF